jgi:outer membrane receptor protein involved in Fe transport
MHLRRLVCFLVALACLTGALATAPRASFAAGMGSISGTVVSVNNNSPIQGASVQLFSAGGSVTTTSGKDGSFSFAALAAGSYYLRVTAKLFQPNESALLPLADGQTISLVVIMQPITTTNITSLGHVTVKGRPVLNTSSAPTTTISGDQFVVQGATQVQTALETIPGITLERYDGGAPGNVSTFTIRGAGGFGGGTDGSENTGYEILVLQDGEPMRNGQYGDFDVSTLTPDIYSRVEVTKGVGGTSLFGANTIGGTINFVTRDPAKTEGGEFIYSAGGYGTDDYNLMETNTFGHFGYLLDIHQFQTLGAVDPAFMADYQPFSGANVIAHPTQSMILRSGLGKFRYDFSGSTYLTVGASYEYDWRDQLGLVANPNTTSNGTPIINPATGLPSFYGFPGDYVYNQQPKYTADFGTSLGGGTLILRYYKQYVQRVVNGLNESPQTCCFLSRQLDNLAGELVQWSRPFGNNNLTLAAGANSDNFYFGELPDFSPATFAQLVPSGTGNQIERTYLVRDDYDASPQLDLTLAGYYSDYDTLQVKRFDPRLGVVYKPDTNSVVRASVGTGFAPPRLADLFTTLELGEEAGLPGSSCPGDNFYCVAFEGNPSLKAETAVGADVGYQRLFNYDGNVDVDFYRTNLTNHIFDGVFPAPPGLFFQGTGCSGSPCPVLFLDRPINLAHAVYQGVEFSGTAPFGGNFSANVNYNIQSAYPTGVDALTAAELGDVVNNQQFLGVPVQKWGWSANYHTLSHATSLFFGANYFGHNNAYNVNPFWVYNGGATIPVQGDRLVIAWTNIFNTNAGLWGNFDNGVPLIGAPGYTLGCRYPSAPYLYCTTAYPVPPHMLLVSFDHRWGSLR